MSQPPQFLLHHPPRLPQFHYVPNAYTGYQVSYVGIGDIILLSITYLGLVTIEMEGYPVHRHYVQTRDYNVDEVVSLLNIDTPKHLVLSNNEYFYSAGTFRDVSSLFMKQILPKPIYDILNWWQTIPGVLGIPDKHTLTTNEFLHNCYLLGVTCDKFSDLEVVNLLNQLYHIGYFRYAAGNATEFVEDSKAIIDNFIKGDFKHELLSTGDFFHYAIRESDYVFSMLSSSYNTLIDWISDNPSSSEPISAPCLFDEQFVLAQDQQ